MKLPILLLTLAATLTPWAANADMKEMPSGLWEIRTKMDIPGMPPEMAAQMGNQTVTHCVKPGGKWTDDRSKDDKSCTMIDSKSSGNKMTWKVKCKDGTTGDGVVTHNGKDAYKSDMTINSKEGKMTMKSEGKLISATCNKK